MKIGVDVRVLMDKNYSGISVYTANLLSSILKQDQLNKYHLFYNSFKNRGGQFSLWKRENSFIKGAHYPNKIFNYLLQKIFNFPKIDSFLGGVDIFFSPHFNFLSVTPGVKLVITVHDLSFLRYPEFFSFRKNFWHNALRIKKLLVRADLIIAVSNNTKNDLVEILGLSPDKIVVVYSGNDYQTIAASNLNTFPEKYSKPLDNNNLLLKNNNIKSGFILFVGNIEPRKNILGLIKAYNLLRAVKPELSQHQLILAGSSGWRTRKIYRAWRKSPYVDDIKFLGYVSKDDKEVLYQQANVFVYPSFYEGFGFPPLEAMSFGVPVVSSNVSSLPEILGEAALLVDPFRSEEIAESLALMLGDNRLRDLFVQRGFKRAAEFSWEKTGVKYLELFKKLNEANK